jgi:cell division transport system permease protein
MKMLRQLLATDIPFARDDAHRLLPVMVACLIAFAALLFSVAISISHTLDGQSRAAVGSLQVEVPRSKAADATLMGSIMTEIKRTSGVREAKIITTEEMNTLLKPWLGEDIALEELSVPVMIDVITEVDAGKTTVDVDGLRRALRKFDSNIRVDDRGPWAVQVTQATSLVQALMIFIALLLVTCVIAMIVLLAKTSLRLHFKTVSLLHMFGATDEYILRQFQYNSAWLAARGGAAGALAAALIFTVMAMLSVQWHSPLVPEISLSIGHGVMLVILPIFTALVALVATRLTVQSMLEHMH